MRDKDLVEVYSDSFYILYMYNNCMTLYSSEQLLVTMFSLLLRGEKYEF